MRRTVIGTLAVLAIALAVWSCREQLVAPGGGTMPGTARTLRVSPSRLDLIVGGSATVTATLLDATGSVVPMPDGFTLTFTSSVPDVFAADTKGVTTGVTAGEGVLRAAIGALAVGIPVSVVSADPRLVIVSGDAQTGAPGRELPLPLVVRAEGPKGDPRRDVVLDFEPSEGTVSPARATTDSDGIATVRWTLGKTAGAQSIVARSKGYKNLTFVATAVVRPVARVVVAPDTVKLTDVAQTTQLTATALDADGKDLLAAGFVWASSNAAVATVSPTGLVTALGAGSSTVTATLGSIVGSSTVFVTLPIPQSRLAFRPDTLRTAVVAGAQVVAAVDVVEAGGLPAASLGAVSCDAPVYEGTPAAPWLVVQSCGDSVRVLVQAATLTAGTWRANIAVRGTLASNSPATLPVEVVVSAAPTIAALPAGQVIVTSTLGADDGVFKRVVELTNGGGGKLSGLAASLTYATGQPVGWIESLALDSANAPTALRFTVRRGALRIGTYDATVHLASTVPAVQPLDIPVQLVVKASAARLGLSADSVEGVSYTNGPSIRVAVDVVERTGLGEAALGAVTCSDIIPGEFQKVLSCGDSIVVLLSPGGNLVGSEVATVRVSSAFTADTVTLRVTRTAARPRMRLVPDSLAAQSLTNGAAVRVAADLVVDVLKGAPAYPESSLGALTCTVQAPAGAPVASVAQCGDSIAITVTPGVDAGTYRYVVDVQAPNAPVTAVRVALPINVTITAAPRAARIGLSSDSITGRTYPAGPVIRGAVAVIELTGMGRAALGTISCSAPIGPEAVIWATVVGCGDSIVVQLRPEPGFNGNNDATVRVTGSSVTDTATLNLRMSVFLPQLMFRPDSLVIAGTAGGATIAASAQVVDAERLVTSSQFGTLRCTLSAPSGAPSAAVTSCASDAVTVAVTPDATAGRFVYTVLVEAPNGVTFIRSALLQVIVSIAAAEAAPVIVAVPTAPLAVTTAFGVDSGVFVRAVDLSNGGGGTLSGLAASITYAPNQSVGWIQGLTLDGATAPTALRFTIRRDTLRVGTYDASVRVTSTVVGVQPLDLAVKLIVQAGVARLVIVSGNAQTGAPNAQLALPLVVRAQLADGQPGRDGVVNFVVTEGSVTPARVSTDGFGVATVRWTLGATGGLQSITANSTGLTSVTFVATAVAPTVARIVITPDTVRLAANAATAQLTATARDAGGNDIPSSGFTWASSDPAVATVSQSGLVTTVSAGTSTVTASLGAIVGSSAVIVSVAALPVISAFPSGQLTFNTTYGADAGIFNRVVDITNAGGGTLSGLAVSVTYAAGQPTGWIENPALDAPTALTALRFTFNRGTLPVGTYDATVRVTSTVAGVLPLVIPVRMGVAPSTARIGLSPDSIAVRSYTSGSEFRAAVAVTERTGLGNAALGTISCSAIKYSAGIRWARIGRCADSVVVFFDTDLGAINRDSATIRVTGSTIADSATLRLRFTVVKPRLAFVPDSLVIATTSGVGSVEASAGVVDAEGFLTASDIRDLRCTLTTPTGAPSATVTSCFTDGVTLRVSPGASVGKFVYTVLVEAPNGAVPITPGVLRVVVTIAAPSKPFDAVVIYGTCAIDKLDKLYCWGKNASGEVGDGTTTQRDLPTPVKSPLGLIVQLHSGDAMKCGINVAPLIPVCWGQNAAGATGQGTFTGSTTVPAPVVKFTGTSNRLGVGPQNACARENETDLWYCWGSNAYGLLGTGSTETATNAPATPLALPGVSVNDVAIGARHACALGVAYDYRLFCWGDGSLLGNGSTDTGVQSTPVAIPFPDDLPSSGLVATSESTCVLNYMSYRLYCWGGNRDGTTGTGGPALISVPTQVLFPGFPDQVSTRSVVAGDHHICAIVGGATYCWGRNEYGQLGTGDVESSSRPVRIVGDKGFSTLAASGSTTCGLTYDGSVWCWGYGLTGELGNGTSGANSPVPVQVLKP